MWVSKLVTSRVELMVGCKEIVTKKINNTICGIKTRGLSIMQKHMILIAIDAIKIYTTSH